MNVLIDTSVWSLALRRQTLTETEGEVVDVLKELIRDARIAIIGPIRQELLSGIKQQKKFEELRLKLSVFKDLPVLDEDYVEAARCYNTCRENGIQGTHIDFLVCAIAMRMSLPIFTLDKDFTNYAEHLPLKIDCRGPF